MAMIQRSSIRREPPFYIESDGEPMGETELHFMNIRYFVEPLAEWFASDPRVYVGGNMFIHYERDNRNRHVSPDVFVVRGVPKVVQPRRRASSSGRKARRRSSSSSLRQKRRAKRISKRSGPSTRTSSASRSIFCSILSRSISIRGCRASGWRLANTDRSGR